MISEFRGRQLSTLPEHLLSSQARNKAQKGSFYIHLLVTVVNLKSHFD